SANRNAKNKRQLYQFRNGLRRDLPDRPDRRLNGRAPTKASKRYYGLSFKFQFDRCVFGFLLVLGFYAVLFRYVWNVGAFVQLQRQFGGASICLRKRSRNR